jgi:hypothetical protein
LNPRSGKDAAVLLKENCVRLEILLSVESPWTGLALLVARRPQAEGRSSGSSPLPLVDRQV